MEVDPKALAEAKRREAKMKAARESGLPWCRLTDYDLEIIKADKRARRKKNASQKEKD